MFRKWWKQAGEIDLLTRQLEFAQGRIDRADQECELLKKALRAEQSAHNKALRRYADQISKQIGLPQKFVEDVEPPKEVMTDDVAPERLAELREWAIDMRNQDIDNGDIDVPALSVYVQKMIDDPFYQNI